MTRLQTRFLGEPESVERAKAETGAALDARKAHELGLVTFAFDDVDWDDEVRIFLEERASFSPDAMTGMEANLRFAGPETMETRIFGRLTAWQNWIFQRPNAVGENGALKRYGTGKRGEFDRRRVCERERIGVAHVHGRGTLLTHGGPLSHGRGGRNATKSR